MKGPLPACVKSVDRIKKEKMSIRRKKTEKDIQLQICVIWKKSQRVDHRARVAEPKLGRSTPKEQKEALRKDLWR